MSIRGLLYQLETELEQELPVRLRQSLPGTRDVYQAQCPDCQLAMRRHHAYRRSIMTDYGAVALWIPVGQRWARRVAALTGGPAEYWCRQALREGLRHLQTGPAQFKTASRLERPNREYRRRERQGTVWSPHNLLILLQQKRGLINQTT